MMSVKKKIVLAAGLVLLFFAAACSSTNAGSLRASSISTSQGNQLYLGAPLRRDHFAWSPDGTAFITTQILSGVPRLIFWNTAAMDYQREISFYEGPAEWIRWSPDSGWILYCVEDPGLGGRVYALQSVDQRLPDRPLLDYGLWGAPVFVEEGRSILIGESLFFSRGANSACRIWRVNLSSGEKRMAVQDAFHDLVPSPSPDTSAVLYTPTEGPESRVYLQDGSRLIPLRDRTPFTPRPLWIGDGTRAVFAGPDALWPDRTAIWLYDSRTRSLENLKEIGNAEDQSLNLFPARDLDWWGERNAPKVLVLMRDPSFVQNGSWMIAEIDPQTRMIQTLLRLLPEEDLLSFSVSPTRDRVAYRLRRVEWTGAVRNQLWVLDRTTGLRTLLHEAEGIRWWAWSPQGDQLAIHVWNSIYLYSF